DQRGTGHVHVVEEERPLALGLVEGRVLHLLREPRGVGIDDEEREASATVGDFAGGGGPGDKEHVLRVLGAGYEGLLAFYGEAVAVARGWRLLPEPVGAGIRLGDREAEPDRAVRHAREIPALLLVAAVAGERDRRHGRADDHQEERHP